MYLAVSKSLVRMIQDHVDDLNARSLLSRELMVLDLDGHSSIQELPAGDVVGIGSVEVVDQEQMWEITFAVTVLTLEDEGVYRLKEIVDHFARRLRPTKQFPIYDPETAVMVASAVVKTGTEVTPVSRAEVRNAISVVVSAEVIPSPAAALLASG